MNTNRNRSTLALAATAIACLCLTAPAAAFPSGDASEIDLADLADGETRTFGEGEHRITATRDGNVVVVRLGTGEGRSAEHSIECNVEQDDCRVILIGDGSGSGIVLRVDAEDGGRRIEVVKIASDGAEAHAWVGRGGLASGIADGLDALIGLKVFAITDDDVAMAIDGEEIEVEQLGDGTRIVVIGQRGANIVQCPEGDTTMRLDQAEEGETFLCPKHGVPLVEVEIGTGSRIIRWHAEDGAEEM